MTTILTNARLILENEIVDGSIAFDETGILSVDQGRSSLPAAIDVQGDYVAPGLVEMHTDNMEKHFMPRPKVFWPNGLAAALVHDAQMAASGVTTVYDAICAGTPFSAKDYRKDIFADVMDALRLGTAEGVFRIDHRIHMRCELTSPDLLRDIEPYQDDGLVQLVSLMDHTPGQRQWRNIEHLRTYSLGTGKTEAEFEEDVVVRQREGAENVGRNWSAVVEMFRSRGIPIATHDDTTVEHVEAGIASGAVISEFPTTVEAAEAAKQRGLATIAGAPNVVRGGSHSGGVSVSELAEKGLLDGLSSDYVPASLLQAVLKLHAAHGVALPEAMGMVTWKVADILGLRDRGHLKPGLRADLLRFRTLGATPVLNAVWSKGERAF
ncbi:alpha-D-ribose 1-methylphosphonate 5-triphosphate diphosphatase [Bosea sp. (in: a-proteobacteria)]|jgi:alpha-D-ribose 1-methylphosphonate 5-triphosphate diphosphatase|uniref:alpha-D-ribose 1-methylphosphonate 5-triphosphate diphosphatase n=1 Tax=Bosea sp. (in: a-proteobacteria) TaxID=1871050 RepID=UPI00086A2F12|nr:alpha-D-ribose 1-methylphosphonate 5-triphosphate diphosphatase [Bosea sp. (in: a-proteobacteria)]MBN9436663.1 alpha-D-ribose 1-methylphosphonate 5-triphosphate diphosphatase [Bosea sp. (in: a-proteobacteria)]MBN9447199.1 alpha-D-ribose 1-methylphosphonate 5-triphosphate diphosphatase [Bosea sp. (in: a-proteobacteria)]ODT46429.1 MAG: phosphonate metabolism protein PhnM [Methylobacterium sp. SCN 67-24]